MIDYSNLTHLRFDINELTTVVYNRVKLDSEGAIVRDNLSQGAAQIIPATMLDLWRAADPDDPLDQSAIADFPLLVFREGTVAEWDRTTDACTFRWFFYDRLDEGYRRINEFPSLLARAYAASRLMLTTRGNVRQVTVSNLSGASVDTDLSLRVRFVTVSTLVT